MLPTQLPSLSCSHHPPSHPLDRALTFPYRHLAPQHPRLPKRPRPALPRRPVPVRAQRRAALDGLSCHEFIEIILRKAALNNGSVEFRQLLMCLSPGIILGILEVDIFPDRPNRPEACPATKPPLSPRDPSSTTLVMGARAQGMVLGVLPIDLLLIHSRNASHSRGMVLPKRMLGDESCGGLGVKDGGGVSVGVGLGHGSAAGEDKAATGRKGGEDS